MLKTISTTFLILHFFFFVLACSDSDGGNDTVERPAVPIILAQDSEPEEWDTSPFTIQRAFVDMDEVVVDVVYDRSVENHFSLVAYSVFFATSPRSVHLLLAHEALGEARGIEAEEVLRFQLDPLLTEYADRFPDNEFDELALQLNNPGKEDNDWTLVYKFSGDAACRYYATEYVVSGEMLESGDEPYPDSMIVQCDFDDQALTLTCRSDFSLLNGETRFVERKWTYAGIDDFVREGLLIGNVRFLETTFSGNGNPAIIPTLFSSDDTINTYADDGRLISTESYYPLEHISWDFLGRPIETRNPIMCDQEEEWTYNDAERIVEHDLFTRSLHFKCIPHLERWIYDTDGNFIRYTWGSSAGQEEWTNGLTYEIKSVAPVCLRENSNTQ